MTRIAIIDGHPDPAPGHYVHALADAYTEGAEAGGHEVRRIMVAELDFPLVRVPEKWEQEDPPADIAAAQDIVRWAEHLVFLYPLWHGGLPAFFKGFFEQLARPDFALRYREKGFPEPLLKGKSARVIVTMGMPAMLYRWYYRAHSLKSLERNILGFSGISPVRHSIIGIVEAKAEHRRRWLDRVRALGEAAA